jgi:hypothetical protein
MTQRSLLASIGAVAGLLVAATALAGIVIEDMPLADGRRALVLDGTLYLPDRAGLLRVAPDGRYALKGGGEVTVRERKRLGSQRLERTFDPQPEPPGIELHGDLVGGGRVALEGNRLFFLQAGGRHACPDGSYRLKGGASLRVLGGLITSLSSLEGFSLAGAAAAQR